MTKAIHPIAGGLALLIILTFWISTAASELLAPQATIVTVKTWIPWGLLLLIPALMAAGASGMALSGGRRGGLIDAKRKRMPLIAANGVLILVPSALFLAIKADAGQLDATFYGVQVVELLAGAVNITLLGLNMRDGLRLQSRKRRRKSPPAPGPSGRLSPQGAATDGYS
jgi:hypothetical protein